MTPSKPTPTHADPVGQPSSPAALRVSPARTSADFETARGLCDRFRAWLWERYGREVIDALYSDAAWATLMADLPRLHAPPDGDILLAWRGETAIGCVMLSAVDASPVQPGTQPAAQAATGRVCEMKRLFVDAAGRRGGVARALCSALIELARARGYIEMRLEAGVWHEEALPLYRSMGFADAPRYHHYAAHLEAHQVIMARAL